MVTKYLVEFEDAITESAVPSKINGIKRRNKNAMGLIDLIKDIPNITPQLPGQSTVNLMYEKAQISKQVDLSTGNNTSGTSNDTNEADLTGSGPVTVGAVGAIGAITNGGSIPATGGAIGAIGAVTGGGGVPVAGGGGVPVAGGGSVPVTGGGSAEVTGGAEVFGGGVNIHPIEPIKKEEDENLSNFNYSPLVEPKSKKIKTSVQLDIDDNQTTYSAGTTNDQKYKIIHFPDEECTFVDIYIHDPPPKGNIKFKYILLPRLEHYEMVYAKKGTNEDETKYYSNMNQKLLEVTS